MAKRAWGALLALSALVGCVGSAHFYWDYVVVGAGPGGLQLGYYLQQAGRSYVLLEKANISGSFYTRYPRHNRLISINKRHTGKTNKEFNMRHDWNSLLSHDATLQMRHYTRDFFPHRQTLVRYLNDYKQRLGINVLYNTEVRDITKVHNSSLPGEQAFTMTDQRGNTYSCRTLVLATGLGKVNEPKFKGAELTESYEDVSISPEDFEGQSVLILGRGNSAFELAESIYGATNFIHMLGRSRVRLSWATHYVGDLRAVNNGLLDTYQLKSLDGVLESPVEDMTVSLDKDNRFRVELFHEVGDKGAFDNSALREKYDRVIRCLGWQFDDSLMANNTVLELVPGRKKRYPSINHNYESKSVPGLFFAGTNSHGLDHRKSSGGFIHGFRYTAQTLHQLLEWRNHGVRWPATRRPIDQLLSTIVKRINEASGTYQMFGVLGDIIAIRNGGDEFDLYGQFPLKLLPAFRHHSGHQVGPVIVLSLEYGANFSGPGKDTFRIDRAVAEPSEGHKSNFLHPVLYYYRQLPSEEAVAMADMEWGQVLPRPDRLHHFVEDFLTTWAAPTSHILPLRRFIETVLDEDLRHFFAEDCMKMALTFQRMPRMCERHFLPGRGTLGTEQLLNEANAAGLLL